MTAPDQLARVADSLTAAFAAKSAAAFEALYADDATVWHNIDRVVQSKAENVQSLEDFFQMFDTVSYTNIDRYFSEKAFIQEHIISGVAKGGIRFEMPACLIVAIRGDKISSIREYVDIGPYQELLDKLA